MKSYKWQVDQQVDQEVKSAASMIQDLGIDTLPICASAKLVPF